MVGHRYISRYSRLSTMAGRSFAGLIVVFATLLTGRIGAQIRAQDSLRRVAIAPDDQSIVGEKLGGYYFAPKALKTRYDELVDQVRVLEALIDTGKIDAADARKQISDLRVELANVQKQIDETKSFVATALVETRSETTSFNLGSEKTLLIVADKIHLVGWDQPQVKCVLEKTVLYSAKATLDQQFAGVQLVHRVERAKTEQVGFSAKDVADSEAKFLASPDGQKMDANEQAAWKKNFEKIFHSGGMFTDFQNKEIDIVEISGLTHDQGNRQLTFEVKSPGGGGRMGSVWQRRASLTVYVPTCNRVGVRGGLEGLEVESTKAPLMIRGDGNRDYQSKNWIKDHRGPLALENVALNSIENVDGPVSLTITADLDNSSTTHQGGEKTQYRFFPQLCACSNIQGDFTARLVKTRLQLAAVSGRIDVINEFGDTTLIAKQPLAASPHRIVSQSGNIELQITVAALEKSPPLLALTECGTVRVSDEFPKLEEVNFTTMTESQTVRRGFMGFKRNSAEGAGRLDFHTFERAGEILLNENHDPGIELLSRGGTVHVTSVQKE